MLTAAMLLSMWTCVTWTLQAVGPSKALTVYVQIQHTLTYWATVLLFATHA